MWWNRKSKTRRSAVIGEAALDRLLRFLVWLQLRLVLQLRKWDSRMNAPQRKLVFVLFFTAAAGWCSWLLYNAVFRLPGTGIKVEQITGGSIPPVAQPPPSLFKDSSGTHPEIRLPDSLSIP